MTLKSQSLETNIARSTRNPDWRTVKFKKDLQPTFINEISLKLKTRYMAGRTRKTPVFRVTMREGTIHISIAKIGWKKAWKKALLTASSPQGMKSRRSVVRHLNRPPKLSSYLKKN
ncbi:hypothetical protein [Psychromonas sp. SP041]|uniref:hypothetical protein n=1 Tax=Psychromonas sp. SP041 TaxID=1365007 RepID=UPI0010C77A8B|nr:hypothetical protein [Psychromonas sp. SP041]